MVESPAQQKGEIHLPWHGCLADFDDAAGERDPGKGDDQARAKMTDTAANGDQK